MSEVLIRTAHAADVRELTNVVRAAYAPWIARLPDLPDVSAGLAEDVAAHTAWVAVSGATGAVIGGLVLVMDGEMPHIANLAVHPDAAGAGVGRTLVNTAEAFARSAGQDRIRLTTHRDMAPTLAFYERLGWRRSGAEGVRVFMQKILR